MKFYVGDGLPVAPDEGTFWLQPAEWNDWWRFRTLYSLYYFDSSHLPFRLGSLKILDSEHAYVADNTETWQTPLPEVFESLSKNLFSVGQDTDLYVNLHDQFGLERATEILSRLRDMVVHQDEFEQVRQDPRIVKSLMRSVTAYAVRRQYPRLLQLGDVKASFDFSFVRESVNQIAPPLKLEFEVIGDSGPPTNVHVLIGRNGAGKTSTLLSLGRYVLGTSRPEDNDGHVPKEGPPLEAANLVYVGFSAFDNPSLPVADDRESYDIPYAYLGLQRRGENGDIVTQTPKDLAVSFADSAWLVASSKSHETWVRALVNLESDPIFSAAEVRDLAVSYSELSTEKQFRDSAMAVYEKLSSGHKIVLLTVTRLVETVTEQTLVLMDEPEGHLHPPLLAAFTRTLSDLMRSKSGIAVVATHSPVVLQEVPRKCAWRIRRTGNYVQGRRPVLETFGENVSTLTSSVFGLEVSDSGFHKMIIDAAKRHESYEAVVNYFGGELGFEARSILLNWYDERRTE
ncbi:AAA family ATPase [Plantibacter sp. H53]|uniref:AAA family ATPase n=1 Tax=Plantibacter sp. H53 TaxID=1827323 RepID=UPI0018D42C0B|nr:AAA family ATPase [Plantibacter sp. H53]